MVKIKTLSGFSPERVQGSEVSRGQVAVFGMREDFYLLLPGIHLCRQFVLRDGAGFYLNADEPLLQEKALCLPIPDDYDVNLPGVLVFGRLLKQIADPVKTAAVVLDNIVSLFKVEVRRLRIFHDGNDFDDGGGPVGRLLSHFFLPVFNRWPGW